MKTKVLLLLALVGLVFSQDYVELSGVKMPKTYTLGGKTLQLNGIGLREKWFLDLYVMGLYVPQKTKSAETIINKDQPTVAKLVIVSSLVTRDKMVSSIREGFEKALGNNYSKMKDKIDKFISFFKKELHKGDVIVLAYEPGTGTKVYLNGEWIGTIKGLDFKQALFKIWLGPDPVDEDLKEQLLGNDLN